MAKKVFEITWHCCNCYHNFIEQYEKGDAIEGGSLLGYHLHSNKCTGRFGCQFCRGIKCPNCESENVVKQTIKPLLNQRENTRKEDRK